MRELMESQPDIFDSEQPNWNDADQVETELAKDEKNLQLQEQSRFTQAARKIESKEKLPHLKLDVFFGAHGSEEDIQGLEKRFAQADIYIPELAGWNETIMQGLRDLSYGRVTSEQYLKEAGITADNIMYGFRKKEAELIYNSFKPIVVLDLPADHPLFDTISNYVYDDQSKKELYPNPAVSFEEFVNRIRERAKLGADLYQNREDYMISQLEEKIKEGLNLRPDLKTKASLNVLMFLGPSHTRIVHQLNKLGLESDMSMSRPILQYGFGDEVARRMALGKEVDESLAAKALLENFMQGTFKAITKDLPMDSAQRVAFNRKLVTNFSTQEIRDLFELPPQDAQPIVLALLNQKGVIKPNNKGDLEKFLSATNRAA